MSEQDKRYLQEIEKHGAQREVLLTLLFGQRILLRTLFRQEEICVQLSKPLASCIRFQQNFRPDMDTRILEQAEIVLSHVGKGR